ncbi:TrkH family potassium uptake protein [Mesobacillus maritimus]|uniref:TrkH family potassium uptake protein n=1 Tax=Mesobacillus maritimus TaxID=1643336 RepID=A0ABS7K6B9_9BACI|nr:TrkH family potassium uptake protein [Mesobacillus maritimus]MBY0097680.1 TrkH family potassium uptake protein [Mesobacillus maritimus]
MFNNLRKKLSNLTPAQMIVVYYSIAVLVSVSLLSLPLATKPGVSFTFMDALFVAVSAVSVTGLTTVNISETFTATGSYILMFIFQFGGIGIMALGTFFWLIIGKKIGLKERQLIMADQNQTGLSGVVKMLKGILLIITIIELFGALLLGVHFLNYYPNWHQAFMQGLFLSVSATTNAGFDITGASMIPYANDYFVQLVSVILMALGAIGFPVLIETKEYLTQRNKNKHLFRFSLFTKITTVTFLGLLVFGTLIILILEHNHFLADKNWHQSFFYALFQSAATRSGGFATLNINDFTESTLLVMSSLMFIGASPSSVGGGIRTTTFALNLLFLYHFARGNRSIKIFKRELTDEDVTKSLVVTTLAILICFTAVVILRITEEHELIAILFEVSSAFGTSGLSMGITPDLSTMGKFVIIILMFIGRVGLVIFLLFIGGKGDKTQIHYPKEKVIIG